MRIIEQYIDALENRDFEALGRLFTENGHYSDYCGVGAAQSDFHLYGREAISMFFRNKFFFSQYSISEPIILNDRQAEFIASYAGYHVMALANLQQLSANNQIRRLTVRPK